MRLPLALVGVLLSLTAATGCLAGSAAGAAGDAGVEIRIDPAGFGDVRPEAVEAALESVADALLARRPAPRRLSIAVSHTDGPPIALYDRSPDGAYLVRLHASANQWHLYVYEFAHELCHVASNYDLHVREDATRYNQWFEEALCETASLFALNALADAWTKSPPAPELAGQAGKLRRYFDLLASESHRRLPPDVPLAAWLDSNEHHLRRDPYQRDLNDLVAGVLLPLFVRNPEGWQALPYLNLDPADVRNGLDEYLRHWQDNAPGAQKVFIAGILRLVASDNRDSVDGKSLQVADASHHSGERR